MQTGLTGSPALLAPMTQGLVADALGLSVMHTNNTLRKLADRGMIEWTGGGCRVLDIDRLRDIAAWEPPSPKVKRPFI